MEGTELSLVISSPEQGQFLQHIEWNRDAFMELVQNAMKRYEGLTFTEEQVKEAKEERARLNALKKAISDQRIRIKNAVMAPYTQFETEVSEITALIDRPIAEIDRQVKAFEDSRKADKKEILRVHFEKITADMEFKSTFEQVFDARYLNVSVTLTKAKKDISDKMKRFRFNMGTIEGLEEEYRAVVRDMYLKTMNIAGAMSERNRLVELKRQEEERKARETERARQATEHRAHEAAENVAERTESESRYEKSGAEIAEPSRTITPAQNVSDTVSTSVSTDVPPAQDPFYPPAEKQYKASFTVYGTKEQILAVRQFLSEHGIRFEKGVK